MKKLINILFFFLVAIIYYGCEDPLATQLISDSESSDDVIDVELLSPNPNEVDYSTGYDSTGVINPIPTEKGEIIVSGVKTTLGLQTEHYGYAQAMFFDKSKPVKNGHGRTVGFHLNSDGIVHFGSKMALKLDHKIRVQAQNGNSDSTLGKKFVTYFANRDESNNIMYGGELSFSYRKGMMNKTEFSIPIPLEIIGHIQFRGSFLDKTMMLHLSWNGGLSSKKIEILFGGVEKDERKTFPIYRFFTIDDGELEIPTDLIKTLPFERFDYVVITFIRRISRVYEDDVLPKSLISSQSIHNVYLRVE